MSFASRLVDKLANGTSIATDLRDAMTAAIEGGSVTEDGERVSAVFGPFEVTRTVVCPYSGLDSYDVVRLGADGGRTPVVEASRFAAGGGACTRELLAALKAGPRPLPGRAPGMR